MAVACYIQGKALGRMWTAHFHDFEFVHMPFVGYCEKVVHVRRLNVLFKDGTDVKLSNVPRCRL